MTSTNQADAELTLEQLIRFLCGEEPMSGRWFGEKYEGEPVFWWRPKLRQLIKTRDEQREREIRDDERKFLERLKVEFDSNISMSAGEEWCESDAADLLNARLATLTNTPEQSTNEITHKHAFTENPNAYTLICRCGVEVSITSQPSILDEED